jgi:hypothetical protein
VMAMGVSSGKLSHKYRPHSHMTREDWRLKTEDIESTVKSTANIE